MQQTQPTLTAKEVFTAQSMVEITGCLCENDWRKFKPGIHNNLTGRAVGFTYHNHLLVNYKPGFMSCETTTWNVLPERALSIPKTFTEAQLQSQGLPGGINPDRHNYDGPGSKIHS